MGIIGANRSPTCGVDTTSAGNEEELGRGTLIEELYKRMDAIGISLLAIGIKSSEYLKTKITKFVKQ